MPRAHMTSPVASPQSDVDKRDGCVVATHFPAHRFNDLEHMGGLYVNWQALPSCAPASAPRLASMNSVRMMTVPVQQPLSVSCPAEPLFPLLGTTVAGAGAGVPHLSRCPALSCHCAYAMQYPRAAGIDLALYVPDRTRCGRQPCLRRVAEFVNLRPPAKPGSKSMMSKALANRGRPRRCSASTGLESTNANNSASATERMRSGR